MTQPDGDPGSVTISVGEYEELRAKSPPPWYRRYLASLIVSSVVGLVGLILDQRSSVRIQSMDTGLESVQTQVQGFAGQIKLVGDRLQSMDTRIQSMDNRLIEVQVKVGTIEGRLGERFGPRVQLPEGPTDPDELLQTAEVPRYNQPAP